MTTADGWSLYSWAQLSQWLRTNLLTETAVGADDKILAAVDHPVRARCLLDDCEHGLTALVDLLTPRRQHRGLRCRDVSLGLPTAVAVLKS